jgi:predicted nucleic acid-binding protein
VILGVDTDVLVAWVMTGTPLHSAIRRLFEAEIRERGGQLALTPQVVQEFLHVSTDPRRFERPLSMAEALRVCRSLTEAKEILWVLPTRDVLPRTLDLLETFKLGRKRILDTALAATLECAGVHRLATLNTRDYELFSFLELVGPEI